MKTVWMYLLWLLRLARAPYRLRLWVAGRLVHAAYPQLKEQQRALDRAVEQGRK